VSLKGEAISSFRRLEIAHLHAVRAASAEGVVPVYAFRLRLWRKDQRWRKDKGETGQAPEMLREAETACGAPLRFASGT